MTTSAEQRQRAGGDDPHRVLHRLGTHLGAVDLGHQEPVGAGHRPHRAEHGLCRGSRRLGGDGPNGTSPRTNFAASRSGVDSGIGIAAEARRAAGRRRAAPAAWPRCAAATASACRAGSRNSFGSMRSTTAACAARPSPASGATTSNHSAPGTHARGEVAGVLHLAAGHGTQRRGTQRRRDRRVVARLAEHEFAARVEHHDAVVAEGLAQFDQPLHQLVARLDVAAVLPAAVQAGPQRAAAREAGLRQAVLHPAADLRGAQLAPPPATGRDCWPTRSWWS